MMTSRDRLLIGVPCGARLRVLRTQREGISTVARTAQIRAAHATCSLLGLAPTRVRLVPGVVDTWQEFAVVAATAEDALAMAEILGLVDVWGVPLRVLRAPQ